MDRQEWLEARRKGLGGTDAAAILGLSPWRTAIDVYEDKLGIAPERPQTAAMRWGLALENAIADAYTEETGYRVRAVGMRRAKHVKDFPMLGSIDRLTYLRAGPPRIVELKTARSDDGFADRDGWRDVVPERRVPPGYYTQVQHYLEVLDLDVADVAVLFGGSDFRVYEIPRDRAYGADLRSELGNFWREYVLTGTYPPAGADDLANLARRFGPSTDDERVATSEQSALVELYLDQVRAVELAERGRDEIRARIEEAMGTTGKLLSPAGIVSWRSHERTTTGYKELAGSLERAVDELVGFLEIDWMTGIARFRKSGELGAISREVLPYLPGVPSGYGPGIDGLRSLYSATSTVRPFRVDRPKENAQ